MQTHFPSLKSILLACLGSAFIGTAGVLIRLSELGPTTTAFYRTLIALPFLALWMTWEKRQGSLQRKLTRMDLFGFMIAGFFFALFLSLWSWSIDHTTIVNASLFNKSEAFFVPIFMWLFFREKQSVSFIIALLIAIVGSIFLVKDSLSVHLANLWGDAASLASGVLLALYLIVIKRYRAENATGFLLFWTGLFSFAFFGAFAYIVGESFWPLTWQDMVSVLGQVFFAHLLGQGLLAYSLREIPVSYAALILCLTSVTAGVLAWLLLKEPLTLLNVIGMILILLSIVTVKKHV